MGFPILLQSPGGGRTTHVLHLHLLRATVVLWAASSHTEERCENEHKLESGKDAVSGQQNKYSVVLGVFLILSTYSSHLMISYKISDVQAEPSAS